MTSGFDVLVQEVIAAKTIEPCCNLWSYPLYLKLWFKLILSAGTPKPLKPCLLGTQSVKSFLTFERGTLSCGLFGPEMQGSTLDKSSSSTSVNLMLSLAL